FDCFFFSSRRRHTRFSRDWSSDVCSSDLVLPGRDGSPHHRRGSYKPWLIGAASTGMYPGGKNSQGDAQKERPVPLLAEPWPGIPVRGRSPRKRSETAWEPIAPGITPHGLARHSHKRAMIEGRVPEVLQHERPGHEMGGIGAVLSQVTPRDGRDPPGSADGQLEGVLGGAGEDAPALAGGGPGRAAGALPEAGRQRGELQDHLPNFSQNGPHPPPPTGDEGRV